MIPKYQRILFWTLVGAILLMAAFLIRGCAQAREKLTRHRDATPLAAPVATPSETVTLELANDADGSITAAEREVALPTEPTARARALLARLMAEYSYKGSAHPLESGPAVDDVFLLNLPLRAGNAPDTADALSGYGTAPYGLGHRPGGQMAVVNLNGAFAEHHPSGIDAETLTIASIVGTLHAAFPQIEQVRFLVGGQSRETLNGHADLMRVYPAVDAATPGSR